MPIDDATREKRAVTADNLRWEITALDLLGVRWHYGPVFATEAEAEALRLSIQWDLAGRDRTDVLDHVRGGGLVTDINYTVRDITEDEAEDWIYWNFAMGDRETALLLVHWMDALKPNEINQIEGRFGLDGTTAGLVVQRIAPLFNALPWLDKHPDVEIADPTD